MPPCGDAVVTLVHSHCVGILRPGVAGGSRQWGGDAVRSSSGCVDAHGGWVDAHGGWKCWPIRVPVAHKAPCTCIEERGSRMTRCAGRCESGVTHHVHSTAVPRGRAVSDTWEENVHGMSDAQYCAGGRAGRQPSHLQFLVHI